MESTAKPHPMYAGSYRHTVDPKNRITVPVRWRRGEVEDFHIFPEQHRRFLIVAPPEEFRRFGESIQSDPNISEEDKRKFLRRYYADARDASTDKQGRLVLPEEHSRKVSLGTDVVLAGSNTRIEIWNAETWNAALDAEDEAFRKVADRKGL
ncbi:MAG TPA: hypothetical protein VIT91_20100 [Chthoniobacterales bacterium]